MAILNYKKQLNQELNDLKTQPWFLDSDPETQKIAIEQQKACYAPVTPVENFYLNCALQSDSLNLWGDWVDYLKENAPYACPSSTLGDVAIAKKFFLTENATYKQLKGAAL